MSRSVYNPIIRRHPQYWKPKGYEHYKTIGELAAEIKTDPSWIRKLERRGKLPTPARIKRGQLSIRLYSPENEEEIKRVLKK